MTPRARPKKKTGITELLQRPGKWFPNSLKLRNPFEAGNVRTTRKRIPRSKARKYATRTGSVKAFGSHAKKTRAKRKR